MKCNIYDFDKTIYDGDSSLDFYFFCVKRKKYLIFNIVKVIGAYFLYFLKIKNKTYVKEVFFSFLKAFKDIDKVVKEFWQVNKKKVKQFYLEKDHRNDIIISASPYFLLKPITKELKVKDLIASDVNKKNGKFTKANCKGEVKVTYLKEKYIDIKVLEVYTDSYSDQPLIDLASKAYLVDKNKITKIKDLKERK